MSEDCFICLGKTRRRQIDLDCACKICVHLKCWNEYREYKGHEECPYCHTVTKEDVILVENDTLCIEKAIWIVYYIVGIYLVFGICLLIK